MKVNVADTNFIESYLPKDSCYDKATNLAAFMGERGDADVIQNMLQYSQALLDGKPRPKPKLRRQRQPIRPELQIKDSLWSDILLELRTTWAQENPENKEQVIAQFKEPLTKNRQLTAYKATRSYSDGYDSDFSANT